MTVRSSEASRFPIGPFLERLQGIHAPEKSKLEIFEDQANERKFQLRIAKQELSFWKHALYIIEERREAILGLIGTGDLSMTEEIAISTPLYPLKERIDFLLEKIRKVEEEIQLIELQRELAKTKQPQA